MVSFGQDNGVIKGIDIKDSHTIKYNIKHHQSKVTQIVSEKNWLVSFDIDSNFSIFNWHSQKLVRTT